MKSQKIKEHYGLLVDVDRCIGCHACVLACKQENDLTVEDEMLQVVVIGPKKIDELRMDFIILASDECTLCQHRTEKGLEPSCVSACPTKALKYCNTTDMLKALRSRKRYQVINVI